MPKVLDFKPVATQEFLTNALREHRHPQSVVTVGEALTAAICSKTPAQVAAMVNKMTDTLDKTKLQTFVQALRGARDGLEGRLELVREAMKRVAAVTARKPSRVA
jgi:hypothetical protein